MKNEGALQLHYMKSQETMSNEEGSELLATAAAGLNDPMIYLAVSCLKPPVKPAVNSHDNMPHTLLPACYKTWQAQARGPGLSRSSC